MQRARALEGWWQLIADRGKLDEKTEEMPLTKIALVGRKGREIC